MDRGRKPQVVSHLPDSVAQGEKEMPLNMLRFLKGHEEKKKNLYSCHVALRMYLWNPDWVVVSTCTYIYIYISLNTRQLFSDVVKKHPQESSA